MCFRFVCILLFSVSFTASSLGSSDSCQSTEVAVELVDLNGQGAPQFSIADFRATRGTAPVGLKSIKLDDGPRRIVLVIDKAKKLSTDTRKAEQLILETLLSSARQNDQFALITARGPQQVVQFSRDHEALLQALATEDATAPNKNGVLDAIQRAVDVFGAPQPGDAIIAIAADLGGRHSVSPAALAKTLQQRRIRLFGIALGPVARHFGGSDTINYFQGANSPLSTVWISSSQGGDQHFHPLTLASGGFVLVAMNSDPLHKDRLKDPDVESHIQMQAKAILRLVTEFYRVEIEAPKPGHWRLDLSESVRKTAPGVLILYPHELWEPCSKEPQIPTVNR